MTSDFRLQVLAMVRRIPHGRVATYGDVATAIERPRTHRAVGNIMRTCLDPTVPCHRVVGAGGTLGGYNGNLSLKRELLHVEGIEVSGKQLQRFLKVRWTGPERSTSGR